MMSEVHDAVELARTDAVAMADNSELVWVMGSDSVSFLDGLLSQSIAKIGVGGTAPSLLLAPNGKLRATLFVVRGDDRVGLVCDSGVSDSVIGDLTRFKIRVEAEIQAETAPVWEIWGSAAAAGLAAMPEAGSWADHGGVVSIPIPFRHSGIGRSVVVGARPDCAVVDGADLEPLRIEIGEPRMGVDLNEKTIPQEGADVAAAVDFDKGCYLGQELVARIDSRGHVNKRLVGLTVAGKTVVAAGTAVTVGDRAVGSVTSAAWSPGRDTVVALAMVRTEVEAGAEVMVGGLVGSVRELPMTW